MLTLFSFIMAVVWSSAMIIAIYFIRRQIQLPLKIDTILLVSLYIACMVRFIVPIEFGFTTEIHITRVYTVMTDFIMQDVYTTDIAVGEFMIAVSVIISIILLAKYLYTYLKSTNILLKSKIEPCDHNQKLIYDTKKKYNISDKIQIIYSDLIYIPISFGVFKKVIILPKEDFTETELSYIILHENTHHKNKDLLIKFLTNIFCIIFWWNPVVYILRKDLDRTLELRCDLTVTSQMDTCEKVLYLQVIKDFVDKDLVSNNVSDNICFGMADKTLDSFVIKRFNVVANSSRSPFRSNIISIITITVFIISFIFSYMFVVQPRYIVEDSYYQLSDEGFRIENDSTYIIENTDGTYTLIFPNGDTHILKDIDEMISSSEFIFLEE